MARLRRNRLPAPLHLGPALLRYRHLSLADRLRIGQAALALQRVRLDDPALDEVTFAQWLADRGQSPTAVRSLWDLITVATINLPATRASAAMGAKVFQTGLLSEASAADVGWSNVPLRALHGERAQAALRRAGVEVRTECRVQQVTADAVVVALGHWTLPRVLDPRISALAGDPAALGTSAIVNVHVVYDRPVTDLPFAASVRGPVHWVFDRTVSSGLQAAEGPGRRQYLAVTMSAADGYLGQPPGEVAGTIVDALADLFPPARRARVLDTLVTKERNATFRAVPGTAPQRPGPMTTATGVVLAGAWTDTGWPATMEGAVRSGHTAARAALVAAGTTRLLPKEVA
jgi:squalene-associated FAD-dependent desaturase